MARPPRKIKPGSGRPAINKHVTQSLGPAFGRNASRDLGSALGKGLSQSLRPGFGGGRPLAPPPSAARGSHRSRGPYRSGGGSLLGSLLAGALLGGNGLDELAQSLGQTLAGVDTGDVGEVSPEQEINTLAPAYPVECPHCGATIPAFVWVCEYCDSPRPVENE
ncbi:MAG: hypothetical protein IK116_03835 [Firmicutes bacterium]|nr:hypothetical protein [Bacillota bacterium]